MVWFVTLAPSRKVDEEQRILIEVVVATRTNVLIIDRRDGACGGTGNHGREVRIGRGQIFFDAVEIGTADQIDQIKSLGRVALDKRIDAAAALVLKLLGRSTDSRSDSREVILCYHVPADPPAPTLPTPPTLLKPPEPGRPMPPFAPPVPKEPKKPDCPICPGPPGWQSQPKNTPIPTPPFPPLTPTPPVPPSPPNPRAPILLEPEPALPPPNLPNYPAASN